MKPSSIHLVPTEILEEILGLVPVSAQLNLCRVSRLLNLLSTRLVYRHITLHTWDKTLICCRSLAANNSTARAVRTFHLGLRSRGALLAPFYKVLDAALRNIAPWVTELSFGVFAPDSFTEVSQFPRLRKFASSLPLSRKLSSFLNRNPSIVELYLSGTLIDDPPAPAHLPNMISFTGSNRSVSSFIAGSSVSHIGISWDPTSTPEDFEATISSLTKSTKSILSIHCFRQGWTLELLPIIGRHLVDLQRLLLKSIPGDLEREMFFEGIEALLPQLKSLQIIELQCDDNVELNVGKLDDESKIVSRWAAICPSLEICTLPSNVVWSRMKQSPLWIPLGDHQACIAWWLGIIQSGQHPQLRQLVMELGRRLTGGEMLDIWTFLESTWHEKDKQ